MLIPDNFFENTYHIGYAVNVHSITNSGLIAGGQNFGKERQTVFFTAVNPMHKNHKDPQEFHLTKPRLASYKQKWKVHQDTVYWVDMQLAQWKGFKFYQTMSNAVVLYDTLPAYCITKAIVMKSEEVIYDKVFASLLLPSKISFKDNWMKELGSEVAEGGKDSQQTQPKTKNPIVRTGRLVLSEQQFGSSVQEIENVSNLTAKAPMKEQEDFPVVCQCLLNV